VWGSSDEKKREFLVQKGLTDDEITEAFKRVPPMSMVRPCAFTLLSSSRHSRAGYLSSHSVHRMHEAAKTHVVAPSWSEATLTLASHASPRAVGSHPRHPDRASPLSPPRRARTRCRSRRTLELR
jgi:hypothetical protein